jgi:hypothetical protein
MAKVVQFTPFYKGKFQVICMPDIVYAYYIHMNMLSATEDIDPLSLFLNSINSKEFKHRSVQK